MATIAIDPKKRGDPHQRYKMPVMQTTNTAKSTIIGNIREISQALDKKRSPFMEERLCSLFKTKCCTRVSLNGDKKCVLSGQFDEAMLKKILDEFIVQSVLCPKCKLPELVWDEKKHQICGACGKNQESDDHDEKQEPVQKQTPVESLRSFILTSSTKTPDNIVDYARILMKSRELSDHEMMLMCLEVLIDTSTPVKALKQHMPVVKRLLHSPHMLPTLLGAFEAIIGSRLLQYTTPILHTLYEADVFGEDFLLHWQKSEPETSVTVPREVAIQMRKNAMDLIDWFESADEDSDNE